ncbi:hypothetical protein ACUXCC_004899 [Cytobacillus horneckiae]|uniref:hypothetical protein n=1 Tax=Cytobacillus horneckiae TaxID=549687 RepID=UPI0019CFB79E|nr:hypothetical protein [Cytobacillus horneckiae]MBN6889594.1 hypothetical protein [Cytobacillus horneckiae]MCM3180934.1 hypothetical protein [Cytobacillus horneckiae]
MNNIKTLNNHELNRVSKNVVIAKFKEYGCQFIENERTLSIKSPDGRFIEIIVKSIRWPTEYVLILKKHMNPEQRNLYVSLVLYLEGTKPDLYLIPAEAFLNPNDLLRDRPNYKEPEFGMNVSNKNMPLLLPYKLENFFKNQKGTELI